MQSVKRPGEIALFNMKRIPAITRNQVAALLKPRPKDSHKGGFGNVVVIGGCAGMTGAALLAGRAALKLGAGCIHVGLLAENAPVVDSQQAELMLLDAGRALHLLNQAGSNSSSASGRKTTHVIAIGCGLGQDITAQKLLYQALKLDVPMVLDADALNILARHADLQDLVTRRRAATILTPHPGEAARLLGVTAQAVQSARLEAALELARRLRCGLVLKGANSLCVSHSGKVHVNKTGNPGMSSPGMGDVLTGMIAALMAQDMNADDALLLAVHLHGAAGDALAKQGICTGMTASEVTDWARWLLNQWMNPSPRQA